MKKQFLIAAAVAALVLPRLESAAFAAPAEQPGERHSQVSAEDAAAYTEARVAALKAGLKLTPDQEKNWPKLEATIRDQAKARAERFAERQKAKEAHERRDALENLRRGAQRLAARAAELEKLADVAKPLYDSLDEGQKRRFGPLLRAAASERGHGRWGAGYWRRHGSESEAEHDGK
ncbi:MAG: Spy/CpxP family protein refolding chaperone [Methylocystis sp.]|nr:Spy/CpxP family protein refolding chaperone [Methylocystis sp.]